VNDIDRTLVQSIASALRNLRRLKICRHGGNNLRPFLLYLDAIAKIQRQQYLVSTNFAAHSRTKMMNFDVSKH
jgi:hypothetical protein